MSEVVRRYRLIVDELVAADLTRVRFADPAAYDELQVFFEDLESDVSWCQAIADPHYQDLQIESVAYFEYLQSEGKNVYRVKFYNVRDWRIITAADHIGKIIAILAIMERCQDYQNDSDFISRLRKSYDALGLASLK